MSLEVATQDCSALTEAQIEEDNLEHKDGQTKLVKPLHSFSIENTTYDRILSEYVNEESFDKSWVIM